ncbi:hypothetical protein ACH6YM_24710 [Klebsiella pneumoniae]
MATVAPQGFYIEDRQAWPPVRTMAPTWLARPASGFQPASFFK